MPNLLIIALNVLMMQYLLQVANLKKESEFHWFKEDAEIIPDVKPDLGSGVCKLPIKLVCSFYPSAVKVL